MSYDLLDEIRLEPHRQIMQSEYNYLDAYEQPDNQKYTNADCPKCNSVFSMVFTGKKDCPRLCMTCGYPRIQTSV